MSSLLRMLDLGAGALLAQQSGVAVSSRNTANVNTEGYTRESVDLRSMLGGPLVGGVVSDGPIRAETDILALRERLSGGELGLARAFASAIGDLEGSLASTQDDITLRIADLFATFSELAASPMDEIVRADVVAAADDVGLSFRSANRHISLARDDADARIREHAREATALAADIAQANRALASSKDPVLEDRRELAARRLAEIVGGRARVDADGKMRFVVAGGAVLVDGDRAARVETTPDAGLGGHLRVDIVDGEHRTDVTSRLDGGAIAGEVRFRDDDAARATARLDQLAVDLATSFNAIHLANAGLDGLSGRNLFTAANGAADLAVDTAVAADPRLIAAGAPGDGAGDSKGALAIADLASQLVAGGGSSTLYDEAITVVSGVGRLAATARSSAEFAEARAETLESLRDSVVGVSLEEEMVRLSQFVRATEASARLIDVVDGLLGRLIQVL